MKIESIFNLQEELDLITAEKHRRVERRAARLKLQLQKKRVGCCDASSKKIGAFADARTQKVRWSTEIRPASSADYAIRGDFETIFIVELITYTWFTPDEIYQ